MPPDDLLDVPSLRALERTRKSLKAAWLTEIVKRIAEKSGGAVTRDVKFDEMKEPRKKA